MKLFERRLHRSLRAAELFTALAPPTPDTTSRKRASPIEGTSPFLKSFYEETGNTLSPPPPSSQPPSPSCTFVDSHAKGLLATARDAQAIMQHHGTFSPLFIHPLHGTLHITPCTKN